MKLFDTYKKTYEKHKIERMSLEKYLKTATTDSTLYANAYERLEKAIGDPLFIDTSLDPRLSNIFGSKIIKQYDCFKDFYGTEESIERFVSYIKHGAQNLEESRQIVYLLGPVASGKSTFAERIKDLMQQQPIYVVCHKDTLSPVFESPLALFNKDTAEELGIPARYFNKRPSSWLTKRLREAEGDLNQFSVAKLYPNAALQQAIAVVVASDQNNQDVSTLVGKLDIRKLEFCSQDDPDAYNYSGALCRGNQGIVEFIEMFKADIKTLNPLLTATQEHQYEPTEKVGMLPFEGIILAHSNETEWEQFKSNKANEALLDRIYLIEFPYCLRVTEEVAIYKKYLEHSSLSKAPCAPKTLELLADFCVLSRLDKVEGDISVTKLKAYDGENMKEKNANAKPLQAYKDTATHQEGFYGVSLRTAFKVLGEIYNYDSEEVAADPIHLFIVLKKLIHRERYNKDLVRDYTNIIKKYLEVEYLKELTKHVQTAYLDSYDEYGQSTFDRYFLYADHWVEDKDYRCPDTGQMYDRDMLNHELEKLEKPAGIANPKEFRHEIVNFILRYKAKNDGVSPSWRSYVKLRKVIEANMFSKTDELLPVISFSGHRNKSDKKKHDSFVERMKELGYTERQVKRAVEWMMQKQKT